MRQGSLILLATFVMCLAVVSLAMWSGMFLVSFSPSSTVAQEAPISVPINYPYYGPVGFLKGFDAKVGFTSGGSSKDGPYLPVPGDCSDEHLGESCQTFVSPRFIIDSPWNKGPLWWKDFLSSPEVSAWSSTFQKDMLAWMDNNKCPSCFKQSLSLSYSLHIEPADSSGGSCSNAGATSHFYVSSTGRSTLALIGDEARCALALLEAANKFQSNLNSVIDGSCGLGCGHTITLSNPKLSIYPNSRLSSCDVSMGAIADITCSDKPGNNQYAVWVEANLCVNCAVPIGSGIIRVPN